MQFLNDLMMGFPKGLVVHFFYGPCYIKSCAFGVMKQVQQGAKTVTSKTMIKHASAKLYKIAAEKTFPTSASSSCRHRQEILV